MKDYSPAETQMIICMTRSIGCTPQQCLKCGWLRDDTIERLDKDEAEYEENANV